MGKPENAVDCWFLNEQELEYWANEQKPFVPGNAVPYAYFYCTKKSDGNLEGYMGRRDMADMYHNEVISSYDYFNNYSARRRIGITFDKITYYEIAEIFTSKPLIFTLKKVSRSQPEIIVKTTSSILPSVSVKKIHFEDLSGAEFERLIFLYVKRLQNWDKIEWLGETGRDSGRDIWGSIDGKTYCYQCANYKTLTRKKVTDDIARLVDCQFIPDYLIIVSGGSISNSVHAAINESVQPLNIVNVEVWNGTELEDRLRFERPDLLKILFEGELLPSQMRETISTESLNDIINYKIKMLTPLRGDYCSNPVEVKGTMSRVPPAKLFYCIEYNPLLKSYWPKNEIDITPGTLEWSSVMGMGTEDGRQRIILVVAAGERFREQIEKFYISPLNKGLVRLPEDAIVVDQTDIILSKR